MCTGPGDGAVPAEEDHAAKKLRLDAPTIAAKGSSSGARDLVVEPPGMASITMPRHQPLTAMTALPKWGEDDADYTPGRHTNGSGSAPQGDVPIRPQRQASCERGLCKLRILWLAAQRSCCDLRHPASRFSWPHCMLSHAACLDV